MLWQFPRRRLTAEEVRDAMLVASDRLNAKAGGPSVVVPVDADLVKLLYDPSQWTVTPDEREHDRRSVYLLAKRNLRLPFMEAFDQPIGRPVVRAAKPARTLCKPGDVERPHVEPPRGCLRRPTPT